MTTAKKFLLAVLAMIGAARRRRQSPRLPGNPWPGNGGWQLSQPQAFATGVLCVIDGRLCRGYRTLGNGRHWEVIGVPCAGAGMLPGRN